MRLSKLIKQILLIFFTCSGVLTTDIGVSDQLELENFGLFFQLKTER